MNTSYIISRILDLNSTVKSLYHSLYKNILDKVETVFYFHKEYAQYEDSLFIWIKSYRDEENTLLITNRLYVAYDHSVTNNLDTVSLQLYNRYYNSDKCIEIPTELAKLIINEFNKEH